MTADANFVAPVGRSSLTERVYDALRQALFEGRLQPGQRLKIRDLAAAMQVSETPVREALVQLARTGALVMDAARSITVARLSLAQYLELRTIRLALEGMAAEAAASRIGSEEIAALEAAHEHYITAERAGDGLEASRWNWAFHSGLYRAAAMPELMALIETIWLRNGPMHAVIYPHAPPSYAIRHRHLDVLEALRRRDPVAAREALQGDLLEGGQNLVRYLQTQAPPA
ncbi:GntR family transcriptional regulator [Roseomonas sp. GC11]|uniref:GntR family transcriptional regulator n=1 Tax=Roseomonas sp. GC11 TaxID=2950546 RepID=UPI00210887B1|nr:GntR family transcriptional regulator [Roseomonas sp. GC11]MCQ4159859.1 GntR family transcriptional regulator [Roseomonas sp. GC11]